MDHLHDPDSRDPHAETAALTVDPDKVTGVLAAMVRFDERLRLSLLVVHGIYAVLVGALMCAAPSSAFTTPAFAWMKWMPGHQYAVASTILLGGVLVLGGLFFGRRRKVQIYGLVLIAGWDIAFAAGLAYAYATWPATGPGPAYYAVAVYLHLATIMLFHVGSLVVWLAMARKVRGK